METVTQSEKFEKRSLDAPVVLFKSFSQLAKALMLYCRLVPQLSDTSIRVMILLLTFSLRINTVLLGAALREYPAFTDCKPLEQAAYIYIVRAEELKSGIEKMRGEFRRSPDLFSKLILEEIELLEGELEGVNRTLDRILKD